MYFSLSQIGTIETVIRTTGALSLFFSILILFDAYRNWSKISTTPTRMIIWWILASIIPGPAMLIGRSVIPKSDSLPNIICILQALSITFGYVASSLWAGILTMNIYLVICRKWAIDSIVSIEWIYHIIAWFIPFGITVLPIIIRPWNQLPTFYGNAGLWCSITDSFAAWRFLSIGMAWCVLVFDIFVYTAVGIQVRQRMIIIKQNDIRNPVSSRTRFLITMSLYVIAFVFTYSGTTINRLANLAGVESFGLFLFQAITLPSVGIFAAMAYFSRYFLQYLGLARYGSALTGSVGFVESNNTMRLGTTTLTTDVGTATDTQLNSIIIPYSSKATLDNSPHSVLS